MPTPRSSVMRHATTTHSSCRSRPTAPLSRLWLSSTGSTSTPSASSGSRCTQPTLTTSSSHSPAIRTKDRTTHHEHALLRSARLHHVVAPQRPALPALPSHDHQRYGGVHLL